MQSTSEPVAEQFAPADDVLKEFGGRLQGAIRHLGLSQTAVCKRVGVSNGFLSDVVRGRKRPGAELLLELRRVIGISTDWLLTGEGSMFSSAELAHKRLKAVRLQTKIARAAEIDGDPIAKEFVDHVLQNRDLEHLRQPRFAELVTRMSASELDDLADHLYDVHASYADEIALRRDALREAVRHFRGLKQPGDAMSDYLPPPVEPIARVVKIRQSTQRPT